MNAKTRTAAWVQYDGAGEPQPLPAKMARLLLQGWQARRKLDEAEATLKAMNERIAQELGAGAVAAVEGVCRVSVAERRTVKVLDAVRLRGVLGARFDDLVKTTVSYKAEPLLQDMASDGDDPLAPSLRECLGVSSSVAVTWRADKPRQE